ncbi:flagellar hook-associated family protein [Rhodomicrobium lacus]|uniref:flagellar hook-associated family protein n=1 Tax=Rhodomicrobium lacus TaxID=2498452 RepID=UPI0026E24172|nr:flagellar hook-associated family protein [Rhodomicrobium lacus]WKW50647.1 flagellar hook-associated family protein [Rhodomicrobium lacus]
MVSTVSTSVLYSIAPNAVADAQAKIAKITTETSSGKISDPVSSLGSQYGLYRSLQAKSTSLTSTITANSVVLNKISTSTTALTSIYSDAETLSNALLSAKSTGDVSALSAQAKGMLESLITSLNAATAGAYVFGGSNTGATPLNGYSDSAEAATASAFSTAFGITQSDSSASSITPADMTSFLSGDFSALFDDASWSSNWSNASSTRGTARISDGQTVTTSVSANEEAFRQLAEAYTMISDLGLDNLNSGTQQTVIAAALDKVNSAMAGISGMQSTLGVSQSQITSTNERLTTEKKLVDNWSSELGDSDPTEASTKLAQLQTLLDTSYALTNRIYSLSLVSYISA